MSSTARSRSARQVDFLYELARQRTREGREELFQSVADLFERENAVLTDYERGLMRDILSDLTGEVETAVRNQLARKLAAKADAPKELVLLLANDQIEVARPILLRSQALRNADLIEIIRHRTKEHQLAIAVRDDLSEDASAALVEAGHEDVIVTLLNNHNAAISDTVMDYLAEQSKRVGRYQEPLLKREDLPPLLAKRMYTWVSAALRQYIAHNYDVDLDDVDDALNDTVQDLTADNKKQAETVSPSTKLVDAVQAAGSLNEAFLLKTMRQGRITIFEISMASLLNLDRGLIRRLVYEPGWEKLAIACKAIELTPKAFRFIQESVARIRTGNYSISAEVLDEPQNFYDGLDVESARRIVRRWQRDADLTEAIDEFSHL